MFHKYTYITNISLLINLQAKQNFIFNNYFNIIKMVIIFGWNYFKIINYLLQSLFTATDVNTTHPCPRYLFLLGLVTTLAGNEILVNFVCYIQ